MINNYSRPQSIIKQIFERTPPRQEERINSFILGPAFQLQRYTDANEREDLNGEDFSSTGQELSYENLQPGAQIDKNFVRVFGEDLEAKLAEFEKTGNTNFELHKLTTPNKIKLVDNMDPAMGVVDDAVTNLPTEFQGRDTKVGDWVRITDPRGERFRRVTAIEKLFTESSYGSNKAGNNSAAKNFLTNTEDQATTDFNVVSTPFGWNLDSFLGNFNDLVNGPSYAGSYGDLFIVTVTQKGDDTTAQFSIRSNSGFYTADNVGVVWNNVNGVYMLNDYTPFQGVTFEFKPDNVSPKPEFEKDQQFIFQIKEKYEQLSVDSTVADTSRHLLIPEPSNPAFSGSKYTGKKDTTYFLEVKKGSNNDFNGIDIYIYDSKGIDQPRTIKNVQEGMEYNLGSLGLTFVFQSTSTPPVQGGVRAGEIYQINASAAKKDGPASILVLNGSAVDTTGLVSPQYKIEKVEFVTRFDGEIAPKRDIAPDLSWKPEDFNVKVKPNLKLYVSGRNNGLEWVPFTDNKGKLFVHYRALTPSSINETIFSIKGSNDIQEVAGKIDQDNTLAYGLLMALSGSQGKTIYAGKVPSNDLEGYNVVLKEASNRDDLYAFAPLTYDSNIINAVKAHVNTMSTEKKKQWRRAYFATNTKPEIPKLDLQSDDTAFTAIIADDGSGYFRQVTTFDANFVEADIQEGDKFRTNYSTDAFGEISFDEYEVALVISEEELLLKKGPSKPSNASVKFEIYIGENGSSLASFVAATSESFGDRRVVNVWVDEPEILINNEFRPQEPFNVAAEIAGLRSALLPQQGLTFTEITSVSRARSMYTQFDQEDLDKIAAAGTFIITQEVKDGPIFIRHQLTTRTDFGSLFYEDSVGVNADEISYAIKDIVRPFIGKRNATPSTVEDLKTAYENVLAERLSAPTFQGIGPQIINIVPETLFVEIDETFKDQINLGSELEIPLPLNTVVVEQVYRTLIS